MLLKYTKTSGAGSGQSGSTSYVHRGTGMRMTMSTASTMTARIHRKGFRIPSKRHPGKVLPGKLHSISRIGPGKLMPGKRLPQRPHPPPCDNSNDSGFGFDQHVELPTSHQQQQTQQQQQQQQANVNSSSSSSSSSTSTNTNLSSNNSSTSGSSSGSSSSNNNIHHHHNSHHHATLQHTPQQHLIRAIPSSSVRRSPAKKLHFLNANEDDDLDDAEEDENENAANTTATSDSDEPSTSHGKQARIGYKNMKRLKPEAPVDLDNDDACSEEAFILKIASTASSRDLQLDSSQMVVAPQLQPPPIPTLATPALPSMLPTTVAQKFMPTNVRSMTRVAHKRQPAAPANSIATSQNGRVQLEIVTQPEQQHRARYQTEGSRGAVKDRTGNGFPVVRLVGYNKSAILQVFIGTDVGRVAPHMFYQACKVAGKNSTQCNENKVDGTMVIEIEFKPDTDMTVTCDCVGILKERNVDVEHRFPDHLAQKNKKKSTRCRMVFRTQLTHDDGTVETLQVCSNPIICTQPPGVPEICKKSLNSCPVDGGLEMFVIGKNFLKDTHVVFQETYDSLENEHQMLTGGPLWEQTVIPDKEYLQQTHLICTVPPYINQNILKPVTVQVSIISSNKKSESHSFVYTPKGSYSTLAAATTLSNTLHGSLAAAQDSATTAFMNANALAPVLPPSAVQPSTVVNNNAPPPTMWGGVVEPKHEVDAGMMPPPITTQVPIVGVRRPSLNNTNPTPMITEEQLAHLNACAAETMKTEFLDDSSQSSIHDALHSPDSNGVCGPHSPTAMQYHAQYARKASIEAMIYEHSNSLPGFPVVAPSTQIEAVAAAVEMAVKNEIAKEIMQQQQTANSIDKFITDLTKSAGVTDVSPQPTTAAAAAATSNFIDHALTDILQQAGVSPPTNPQQSTTNVLERSLSISSNSSSMSSNSNAASPMSNNGASPVGSLNGHSSPLTQDVILNSESTLQMQNLLPTQISPASVSPVATANDVLVPQAAAAGLSTDIIMNPSVSPSTILCSANGAATAVVPNTMAPHQVTMANSILNDIAMQEAPTQQDATVAALALSNIINGCDIAVPPVAPVVAQPEVTTATSTAVSNMIIKAAADFISTQEQQCVQQNLATPANSAVAAAAATADPLVNLLLNQNVATPPPQTSVVVAAAAAAAVGEVQSQYPTLGITPTAPQESPLIVALATENALRKSVAAAAITTNGAVVTQQTASTQAGIHSAAVGAVTTAVPLQPPIPQELTTMSDQDLISYINPSTFDQI